jgi:KDO2-lipid IV(A) lauroyltransferase
MVDATFASYGRYWAESLTLPSLGPGRIAEGIHYRGFEHIDGAIAEGGGVILALPHLGGWEWAGADMARRGFAISVVVERLADPQIFDWFSGFRERLGMRIIPTGPDAAVRCATALADNGVLCLLCDRVVGGSAEVEVPFFGERTSLPAGPAVLSIRTGAPILPVGVYFERAPGSHVAVILPPVEISSSGRLRDRVAATTQALARDLESLIRAAPTQWHLLQPNWPSDPGWKSLDARPG